MSPAQGAASGDAASPHGSSCIQYASAPTSTSSSTSSSSGKSQLQQLLATDPTKGSGSGNNDGLTKQQLDLIHQIMEQTQRQSQSAGKPAAKPAGKPNGKTSSKTQNKATWSSSDEGGFDGPTTKYIKQNNREWRPKSAGESNHHHPDHVARQFHHGEARTKPVECNLCHRKFKNIPALNGHMRLHGGYFKKDSKPNASPLYPIPCAFLERQRCRIKNIFICRSSAPSSINRGKPGHSDADAFRSSTTQQEAQALADLILKREKATVKRTTSDPGQSQSQSSPLLHFQSDSFTLANVTYQTEEAEFISSTLQDEVFTRVQDTMLIQGVDPNQLASIQFQTETLLQNQNDQQLQEIKLEDITLQDPVAEQSPSYQANHLVNQELQAVLDSPTARKPCRTHSPAQYARSPHTITAQSPLQSPLGEARLAWFCLPHTTRKSRRPKSWFWTEHISSQWSPPTNQDFDQIMERGMYDPPQASSPLSAAFFTSTMSSSAEVEEALEEVLPGEPIYPLTNSPPPQSPLGLTPVSSPMPRKNFVLNTQIVTQETGIDDKNKVQKFIKTVQCAIPTKQIINRPTQLLEVKKGNQQRHFPQIPASPVKVSRKRPRTEPLQLPVLHQSKLRATRSKPQGSARYTPQPILNPQRPGTGLYTNLKGKLNDDSISWNNDPIPESDSTPHINLGPQFQCKLPLFTSTPNRTNPEPTYEDLLWDPGINNCTDSEVDMYLDFACCAAVPGGGRNKEYAMHLLHMCGGNIHDAMLRLMQPSPNLPTDHPLLAYQYSESDKWSSMETEIFHKALLKYDKDFRSIAQEIGTKTIKQCVQFYYVWKKVCTDEYRRLKQTRERKNNHLRSSESEMDEKLCPDAKLLGIADSGSPMPVPETRGFVCEFPDCSAYLLNPVFFHRVFTKIKSRSAHMKSHRPPDAEPVKRKEKDSHSCTSYELSVPSPFST
ncbi:hypothetical protein NQ317_004586 [Molorchus minor]|uniref:Transcriptional-regulating factor 1 n=1 Tax=Molorchus minor TaxID=1323400 RepID=A0ABQ9JX78_9CUCU|nr:hypothetical protein NQ317_004586 [Molorchus minor]